MQPNILQLPSQKIAYYESSGTGPAIMLIHGNSSSGLSYQHQINSALGEKYRLVAIDLPGHGNSEPFAEMSAYGMPGYAAVVAAAAEALHMQDAVFVGWSLGGHIVLEAHNQLKKAKGFVLFGTPPLAFPPAMEEAFLPNPVVNIGFKPDVTEEEARAYTAAFFTPGVPAPEVPFVTDVLRTDGNARAGLAASIRPNGYQDEVEIVANLSIPLAIFHGEEEQLVNAGYIGKLAMPTLWRNEIQVISGAGHAAQWEQPEEFNNLLEAFVTDVL
ncbi:MAG: alpha/beta hydrolase [Chloroflexi bacterium]|nr:alpha/beta hydrolase [Chloroflexota bacterium]